MHSWPVVLVLAGLVVAGCGAVPEASERPESLAPSWTPSSAPSSASTPTPSPFDKGSPEPVEGLREREASPAPPPDPAPLASDGAPRRARLTIPALGLDDSLVRPHRGTPDDARGTRIQDRGAMASPYGTGGLVGPGGLGNYLVTGHRTSSTKPFEDLPDLRVGARVYVEADGIRYTYEITDTRRTSFRSRASLRKQSAAVPGRPGVPATRAMITLSTCRTPEDRAEGNDWSDRFGNPEHRIDKIGVLIAIRPR